MASLSIGVNAYEANVARRVGSNLYAFKLLSELEKQTRGQDIEWTVYLPSPPLLDLPKERDGFRYIVCPPKKLWTLWRLPLELYLHRKSLDVFLSLGHYAPRFCPYPQAICILDLAFLKFPQFFLKKDLYQLTRWTAKSAAKASHIFTISMSAQQDILEQYQKSEAQTSVIYPGVDQSEIPLHQLTGIDRERVQKKYGLEEERFIVALGTIQPRKNIISAIKAFEQINPKFANRYKLVLIGKSGWLTEEFEQMRASSSQKDNLVVTGYVDDSEKWCLLRGAAASILVGYYEGFGIPAVESMSVGVTPVVAKTASLPEVVGEFGVQVDPYSIEDIARGLEQILSHPPDPMARAQMVEWAKQFSWETSAKKMLEVLISKFQNPNSKIQKEP